MTEKKHVVSSGTWNTLSKHLYSQGSSAVCMYRESCRHLVFDQLPTKSTDCVDTVFYLFQDTGTLQ